MPATYTGNPATITPRQAVQVTNPVDGDPRTAASNNTAVEKLADIMKYVMDKMGIIDQASTWTALQTFTAGLDIGDDTTVDGNLSVNGNGSVAGNLSVDLDLGVDGDLGINGEATFGGDITAASGLVTAANLKGGEVELTGTIPAKTDPRTNMVTRGNIPKAIAQVFGGNGGVPSLGAAGFNVKAIAASTNKVTVTLATPMGVLGTWYCVTGNTTIAATGLPGFAVATPVSSAGGAGGCAEVEVKWYDETGALLDAAVDARFFGTVLTVYGSNA